MDFKEILYTKEEGVATITLNRAQAMNALTPTLEEEWAAAIEEAKQNPEVKVLVVTGTGRAFCTGANPRALAPEREEIASLPLSERIKEFPGIQKIALELAQMDKPYIGSINGAAVGGGMDLASLCDVRIASEQARFGMGFIRMGMTPAAGCYLLPRIVGIAKAFELIWTGKLIDAQEALRIGYVNQVVPHEQLDATTRELAIRLSRGPSVAIQLSKRLIYHCLDLDLNKALDAHRTAMVISHSTEDALEGPKAWIEKREPIFRGE